MYIEKTTAEERLVIERAVDGVFLQIDNAHFIIMDVLETYFMEREQKDINKFDAEKVGIYLNAAADMIFDALLQYYLTIGEYEWRGVEPHLRGAERANKAIAVNKAITKCYDVQYRGLLGAKQKRLKRCKHNFELRTCFQTIRPQP